MTDRQDLYDRAQFLRDHGRVPGDVEFFYTEVAYKYKMSSMQAAWGLVQLERIDDLVPRKRDIFEMYRDAFRSDHRIALNAEQGRTKNSFWMFTAIWERSYSRAKNEVVTAMRENGIDARPFFHPLSSLPAYNTTTGVSSAAPMNVVSYDIASRAVNLPSGFNVTRRHVSHVRETLLGVLSAQR